MLEIIIRIVTESTLFLNKKKNIFYRNNGQNNPFPICEMWGDDGWWKIMLMTRILSMNFTSLHMHANVLWLNIYG